MVRFCALTGLFAAGCAPPGYADNQSTYFPRDYAEAYLDGPDGDADTDADSDADTDADTDTDTDVDVVDEACFLGENRNYQQCYPTVAPSPMPSGYDYPDPLNNSEQYRAPERWLDLTVHAPSDRLAPNFQLEEVAQEYKGRYAVVQPHAIERLQDMRDILGALIINSGYRNVSYNESVGGVEHSRHIYGDAFDIDPVNASLSELADACEDASAGYVGVYETHIHCDWRDDELEVAFFGAGWRAAPFSFTPTHDAQIIQIDDRLEAPAFGWDEGEPLRIWSAFDQAGDMIAQSEARTWRPPQGTHTVEVEIGMRLIRTWTP